MISIYETPYKNVHINVSAPLCTVRTSGGFDSGLLLYMVAKTCSEHNPTAEIQPITVVRTNEDQYPQWHRVDNRPIVDSIVQWVRGQFPQIAIREKVWKDAFQWWENGNITYTDAQKTLVTQWVDPNKTIEDPYKAQVFDFNGVTKNPPVPMSINNMHQHRELKRDYDEPGKPAEAENSCSIHKFKNKNTAQFQEPFRNSDKRVTIYLAREFGIFDDLNRLTRSCEGGREETSNWTKVCGTCWWCQERAWAMESV